MKKFLFFFLLLGFGIAFIACSDDDEPKVPFQLVTEGVDGLSGNTLNVFGYENKTVEIPLKGVTNDVSTTVTYDPANETEGGWVEASSESINGKGDWRTTLKVKGYDKNKQRKATLTLKSGDESLTINILQQGAPIPGQLKFAEEQPEGFSDGNYTLMSMVPANFEIAVTGITEELTVEVREADAAWLGAEVTDTNGKIKVSVEGYRGLEDRIGIITIKSGIDELLLQVTQTAVGDRTEMVVVCEGLMRQGNAALFAIKYSGELIWDIFRDKNDMPLGDVAQSMIYLDGKYFVVINNSKQIKVVEPGTFKLLGTIDYVQSSEPRFMVPINDKEAVVSDLTPQLTIVNYKDYSVVKHINLDQAVTGQLLNQIEKMTRVGDKIFCAALGNGAIWVFDVNNISATSFRRIPVRGVEKTAKMLVDKNGMLWVMGSYGVNEYPQLFCIDPVKEEVVDQFQVPVVKRTSEEYVPGCITGSVGYNRMDLDPAKGKLYFVLKSLVSKGETSYADQKISAVYSFDVDTKELKSHTQLPELGMMYGMNVSPAGDIYLCDCLDYTAQRGYVRLYRDNALIESKKVGVYPRMIHFTENEK